MESRMYFQQFDIPESRMMQVADKTATEDRDRDGVEKAAITFGLQRLKGCVYIRYLVAKMVRHNAFRRKQLSLQGVRIMLAHQFDGRLSLLL